MKDETSNCWRYFTWRSTFCCTFLFSFGKKNCLWFWGHSLSDWKQWHSSGDFYRRRHSRPRMDRPRNSTVYLESGAPCMLSFEFLKQFGFEKEIWGFRWKIQNKGCLAADCFRMRTCLSLERKEKEEKGSAQFFLAVQNRGTRTTSSQHAMAVSNPESSCTCLCGFRAEFIPGTWSKFWLHPLRTNCNFFANSFPLFDFAKWHEIRKFETKEPRQSKLPCSEWSVQHVCCACGKTGNKKYLNVLCFWFKLKESRQTFGDDCWQRELLFWCVFLNSSLDWEALVRVPDGCWTRTPGISCLWWTRTDTSTPGTTLVFRQQIISCANVCG